MIVVIQKNDDYNAVRQQSGIARTMGHSQAEKAASRERILAEAARQVRREGLESLSVGPLMQSAGLTHGGFYGHFESRAALLAQALERALTEGEGRARAQADAQGPGRPRPLGAIARSYLSRAHRDDREAGCAMAALVSDVGRADDEARATMSRHVDGFVDAVAQALDGDEERALVAVAAMVGALALSRTAADPARADAFLRAVRRHLSEGFGPDEVGPIRA